MLLIAACGDPTLDVVVDVPDDAQIETLSLRVLLPPVTEPFTCDDVAFRIEDPETVDLSAIVEANLRRGASTAALRDVPRDGDKLLLAEGFDADGELLLAGCAPVGDIDEDTTVVITTEPATLAELPTLSVDKEFPPMVPVVVTDVDGERLPDIATRWLVVGPGGESEPGAATSNDNGLVAVRPALMSLAGPRVLEVQVRWLRDTPPILNGFAAPDLVPADRTENTFPVPSTCDPCGAGSALIGDPRASIQVGRVGPNGELGFAALSPIDPVTGERTLSIYWVPPGTRNIQRATASQNMPRDTVAIGVVPGSARDRVVTKRGNQWLEFTPNETTRDITESVAGTNMPGDIGNALRIVSIADCDGGPGNEILARLDSGAVAVYDPESGFSRQQNDVFTGNSALIDILESGCISDTDGVVRRAVAFDPIRAPECDEGLIDPSECPTAPIVLVVDQLVQNGNPLRLDVFGAEDSVGFAPALGDSPELFLSHRVSFDGQGIGKWQLNMDALGGPDLDLVDSDDTVFAPLFAQGGDFDGDGLLDVGAFVVLGAGNVQSRRILMSLGVEHRGKPLVGVSDNADAVAPYLRVADFDDDGFDDALFSDAFNFGIAFLGELER